MRRLPLCMAVLIAFGLTGCELTAKAGAKEPAANEPEPIFVQSASADPVVVWATDGPTLQWGACPPGMPEGCQIAVLHGNPAKPNADVLLRVPAGSAIAPHWHSSAERMMLVNGQLSVKYQGNTEQILSPGSYAYGPAKLPHRADCRSNEPCTLFIAFEGPVDLHSFNGEL